MADALNLPIVDHMDRGYEVLLTVTAERLELRSTEQGGPGPVYVDFVSGAMGYSRRVGGARLLYAAIGVRGQPRVLDATAGLGQDAFLLACKGCRVVAVERSPIVAALLQDAMDRGMQVPALLEPLRDRLHLQVGDARDILRELPPDAAPDVIYLDPMYPERAKSALNKKEMRILRRLVGDDEDANELLAIARRVARKHVVVKRPRLAPALTPDITRRYEGRSTRYDIYACLPGLAHMV